MNMNTYDKIKELAHQQGFNLQQVAEQAGIAKNLIYSWKTSRPNSTSLMAVANVLNTTTNYLLENKKEELNSKIDDFHQRNLDAIEKNKQRLSQIMNIYPTSPSNKENLGSVKPTESLNYQVRIPVLGTIACGNPIFSEENVIDYRDLILNHKPSGTLFCLECKGHSMEPLIPNGAFVTIRKQPTVENGQIAAVQIGDEITLKRIEFYDNEIILKPENPSFNTIILNKQHPGQIIGRSIHLDASL